MDTKMEALWAVFGMNAGGRPHAAKFPDVHGDLAQRAAKAMGFHAVRADTPDAINLVNQLPLGRVYETGKSFAPFVTQVTYDELLKLAPPSEPVTSGGDANPAASPPNDRATGAAEGSALEGAKASSDTPVDVKRPTAAPIPSLRDHWNEIIIGSEVLSTAPGVEGWWEAEVIGVSAKGKMLTLRWKGYEGEPAFMMPRTQVALPFPAVG